MNDYAYSTHKEALCGNGYSVVPVKGKRPLTPGWQKHPFCSDPPAKRRSKKNIGIKTGHTVAIDLDIHDADTVDQLIELAGDTLGDAPVRVGRAPKALLVYRTENPFKKIVLKHTAVTDGQQIEILGVGQQFVALGVHPDTGKEYTWDEDILGIHQSALTVVTEDQVRDYLSAAAVLLGVDAALDGGGEVSDSTGTTVALPETDAFLDEWALKQIEPGKWNGNCPAGEEHANGKLDGFVYWQAGYHGQLEPNAHCSHGTHANWTLADFERYLGVSAGTKDSMAALAALLRDRTDLGPWAAPVNEVRAQYPASMKEVSDYVRPEILPHPEMGGPQDAPRPARRQPATYDNIRCVMDAIGASVAYNELTKVEEVTLPWLKSRDGYNLNSAYSQIAAACMYAGLHAGNVVKENLDVIAKEYSYHPFRNYLEGLEWDGKSRIHQLGTSLTLEDEHERALLDVYLRRFLIQIVEGTCAKRPGQLRGLLLLCGAQGVGKTHWLSQLVGPSYFRDGVSVGSGSVAERDFLMATTNYVLVELGELDATFRKADVAHLKALLTRQSDTFRAPYAAKVSKYDRRVAYCGSVNDISVLVDPTGNTRFWPIEVASIKWDFRINRDQLWAEARALWLAGEGWQLTSEEEQLRSSGERKYRALSMAEEFVDEYFDEATMATPKTRWAGRTCKELCEQFGLPIDRKTLNEMGHALRHVTGANHSGDRRISGKRKAWLLPAAKAGAHLTLVKNKSDEDETKS